MQDAHEEAVLQMNMEQTEANNCILHEKDYLKITPVKYKM